jgi:hypothetical protein
MKNLLKYLPLLLLCGCAGYQRSCASNIAQTFGGDWIVVQYKATGEPINCWKLENTSISNEEHSDGIYWLGPNGHLVHISGWYNRVQVGGGNFDTASKLVGVDMNFCKNGKYVTP